MPAVRTRMFCPSCGALFRRALRCCPLDGGEVKPLPPDPLIGQEIADLSIVALAGERRDCRIYHALDHRDRTVELQVLFGELAAIRRHRWRFLDGVELASRFQHPNIHLITDFGCTPGGVPYAVAAPSQGLTLAALIERDAPLAPERAVELGRGILAGLAHVHERGSIHGALTADRVLVDTVDGREVPRLCGFSVRRTGAGRPEKLAGAMQYVAPEQIQGAAPSPAGDLYAVGVLLYTMLAGRAPFQGAGLAVAMQHRWSEPPPIHGATPDVHVDERLERLTLSLLGKDPAARGTVVETLRALGGGFD